MDGRVSERVVTRYHIIPLGTGTLGQMIRVTVPLSNCPSWPPALVVELMNL